MAKEKRVYTNNDRFVEAFRKLNKYDDRWVEHWFNVGEALEEADVKNYPTGFDDNGFQHGEGI